MHAKQNMRLLAVSLVVPALFIAGCSGGSSSGGSGSNTPTPTPVSVTATTLAAVTTDGRLIRFNSSTPRNTTTLGLSGISNGTLLGIDYRFAPDAAGSAGLYGLATSGAGFQLYRIVITGNSAVATAVGSAFSAPLGTDVGFDFNPNVPSTADPTVRVDRIRVVSSSRVNLRLVPNTGAIVDGDTTTAGTQFDGTLTYAAGDLNATATPRVVGAAYTNNDTDIATGTVNYAIDLATGYLVTQGRPAGFDNIPPAVSPNTGQLFSVGRLGVLNLSNNVGFDIAPGNNLAFLSSGNNLYTVNLTTGAAASLGAIGAPTGSTLRGLAVLP